MSIKYPFTVSPSPQNIEVGNEEIGAFEFPRKYALTAKEKIFIEEHGFTSTQAQKLIMSRGQKIFTEHNERIEREIVSLKEQLRKEKDNYKRQDLNEKLQEKLGCLLRMSEVFTVLNSGSALAVIDKGVDASELADRSEEIQKEVQDKRDLAYVGAMMTRIIPNFTIDNALEFRNDFPALFAEVLQFANKEEGGKDEWDRQELESMLLNLNRFYVDNKLLADDFNSVAMKLLSSMKDKVKESVIKRIKQQFGLEEYQDLLDDEDFKSSSEL